MIMLKADYSLERMIQDYNKRSEKIPDSMKNQLITQLVIAINSCNQNKIFHRDIKTKNILIKKFENETICLYLADFGEASVTKDP